MAFKLNKADDSRKDEAVTKLNELASKLEDEISKFNATMEAAQGTVQMTLEEYNETLGEARGFIEDIANQMQSDFGDKSEKWQEGERGQAVQEWITAWEQTSLDDIELDFPDELDFPAPSHADDIEALPASPD